MGVVLPADPAGIPATWQPVRSAVLRPSAPSPGRPSWGTTNPAIPEAMRRFGGRAGESG